MCINRAFDQLDQFACLEENDYINIQCMLIAAGSVHWQHWGCARYMDRHICHLPGRSTRPAGEPGCGAGGEG